MVARPDYRPTVSLAQMRGDCRERRLIIGKGQPRLAAGANRPRNDQFRSESMRKSRKTGRFPLLFQAARGTEPEFLRTIVAPGNQHGPESAFGTASADQNPLLEQQVRIRIRL